MRWRTGRKPTGGIGGVLRRTRHPHPGLDMRGGDVKTVAEAVGGLGGASERAGGGDADPDAVARWLDSGVAPNGGECGRAHGKGGVHGFDLTFLCPRSRCRWCGFSATMLPTKRSTRRTKPRSQKPGVPERACWLHPVHNPVTGEKRPPEVAGFGSRGLSARDLAGGRSAPAHPRAGSQSAGPR